MAVLGVDISTFVEISIVCAVNRLHPLGSGTTFQANCGGCGGWSATRSSSDPGAVRRAFLPSALGRDLTRRFARSDFRGGVPMRVGLSASVRLPSMMVWVGMIASLRCPQSQQAGLVYTCTSLTFLGPSLLGRVGGGLWGVDPCLCHWWRVWSLCPLYGPFSSPYGLAFPIFLLWILLPRLLSPDPLTS